jgi:cytochrome b pre-mRNA-processing protein 3
MARSGLLAHSADPGQADGLPWWRRATDWLQGRRARRDAAHALYMALVAQARQPVFYAAWGVPDSRDGRLELVMLHAILVMRRLRRESAAGQALAQDLFDVVFADLDRHLREWGVGDLSVGKHVKKLAQSFFGRASALDPLLDAGEPAAFDDVLRRNVYAEAEAPDALAVRHLGTYLCTQDRWLLGQDGAGLLAGRVTFAPP